MSWSRVHVPFWIECLSGGGFLVSLGGMKKIFGWVLVAAAPCFLVAPVMGQEKSEPKAEKTEEAKKPTLTFYFFDK